MDYGDGYIDLSDEEDFVCVGGDCISSDDDAEDFNLYNALQKAASSKKPLKPGWKNAVIDVDDDEDEFEKEMSAELSATITSMANKLKPMAAAATSGGNGAANATGITKSDADKSDKEFYDEVYFDSDESDNEEIQPMDTENEKRSASEKRRFMSNDELLYDPNMDDRDQAWVDEKRRSYQPRKKRGGGKVSGSGEVKGVPLPQSDAVLNCPACLTTLTRDCQRHTIYQTQYRAMFVSNCIIDFTQKLSFPNKVDKKNFYKNKRKNKNKSENNPNNVGQMFINNIALVSVDQNNDDKIDENKEVENSITKSENSCPNATNKTGKNLPTKEIENGTESTVSMDTDSSETNNILNQEGKQTSQDENSVKQQGSQSKLSDASEWHLPSDPVASNIKNSKLVHNAAASREKASKESVFGSLREVYMQPSTSKIPTSGSRANLPKEKSEFFHPVSCSICNTKIAVYDSDEVYHFFNTVTSY